MLVLMSRRHLSRRASRRDQRGACGLRVTGGIGDGSRSQALIDCQQIRRLHVYIPLNEGFKEKRDLIRVVRGTWLQIVVG